MVGGWLIDSLRDRRPDVEVVAPRSAEVDLRSQCAVEAYLKHTRPSLVIHAAGRVGGIAENMASPVEFLHDNMVMSMNVIKCSADVGVSDLINVGSSCMYPRNRELLHEDDVLDGPLEPTNEGYALAKVAADRLCEYLSRQQPFAYRTVIPSNLYGPRDHFEERRGHLIANAIRKVHEASRVNDDVEVWGDGTARREFTYVQDVTDWIADASRDVAGLPQRVNIGIGVDHTVLEFYQAVARTVGYEGAFRFDTSRPTGMARKLMDSSVARSHGWSPPTALQQGLSRTYDYFLTKVAAS